MGQMIWISGMVATIAIVAGLWSATPENTTDDVEQARIAYVSPAIGEPESVTFGESGSALATAAFGMAALQPETYDGTMVFDIIDASHLGEAEKRVLFAELKEAESGRADLSNVLAEVRVALAVD